MHTGIWIKIVTDTGVTIEGVARADTNPRRTEIAVHSSEGNTPPDTTELIELMDLVRVYMERRNDLRVVPPIARNENLDKKINSLELSVRLARALEQLQINYVGELVQLSLYHLSRTNGIGKRMLVEIVEILTDMGLSLGMQVHGWRPPTT